MPNSMVYTCYLVLVKDLLIVMESPTIEPVKKKRGRKPGTHRKGYFYEEEEQAFQDYINSTDAVFRNRIFNEKLLPAFTKMIESLIRRYTLFTPSEDFTDTFYDTMSFLMTKIDNFDATKGCKLYSYCGTICKNYLILKRSQDMKSQEKKISYDSYFLDNNQEKHSYIIGEYNSLNSELIQKSIDSINKMLKEDDLTDTEQKVGYALIELLNRWEDIFQQIETNKFTKTSFLYFIKALTNLTTSDIRNAMKKYKQMYFLLKKTLLK